jgi:hypothetical protein
MSNNNWSFAQLWNAALETDRQREVKARDYVWASELGRGYYDRYFKMKGRVPETPPGVRAQRKFEAGNLTEWVMQQVLVRAGVLQAMQERLEDTSGPIRVSGRCDFMAGGVVQEIDLLDLGLPETFALIAEEAIHKLKEKYPEGLREQGLEIKSCAGMMFDRYEKAPAYHHALQAFFYAHSTGKPYLLVYVSRDDLRVCQWVILPESEQWGREYDKDLVKMAEVMKLSEQEVIDQIKEPLLKWDPETGRFGTNFEIQYSAYLTDYGFDDPEAYRKPAQSAALRLSNLVKKIKEGKPFTKVNDNTLVECAKFFPEAEQIINDLKEQYVKS